MTPAGSPKFVAVIDEVGEVSLTGLAEAGGWARLLHAADLQPARRHGKVQLLVSAVQARYMGVPFRELSVSVYIRHPRSELPGDCLYLAHAFSTSRLFAFLERTFFRTPYYPARVEVDAQLPVSFAMHARSGLSLTAAMARDGSQPREPIRYGHESWEGPIFLPRLRAKNKGQRSWFAARLAGDTQVYPFLPAQDELSVRPSPKCPVLQLLAESNFAGREWIVRHSAIHARSKTYGEARSPRITKVEAPALETPGYG